MMKSGDVYGEERGGRECMNNIRRFKIAEISLVAPGKDHMLVLGENKKRKDQNIFRPSPSSFRDLSIT